MYEIQWIFCFGDKNEIIQIIQDVHSNTFLFIVDGMWGQWTAYGQCSRTCGGGTIKRQRLCNKPIPPHEGLFCPGLASQTVRCNKNPCPSRKRGTIEHQKSVF